MFGLGLDYGLGFSLDIWLRQDPQLRVSSGIGVNIKYLLLLRSICHDEILNIIKTTAVMNL